MISKNLDNSKIYFLKPNLILRLSCIFSISFTIFNRNAMQLLTNAYPNC